VNTEGVEDTPNTSLIQAWGEGCEAFALVLPQSRLEQVARECLSFPLSSSSTQLNEHTHAQLIEALAHSLRLLSAAPFGLPTSQEEGVDPLSALLNLLDDWRMVEPPTELPHVLQESSYAPFHVLMCALSRAELEVIPELKASLSVPHEPSARLEELWAKLMSLLDTLTNQEGDVPQSTPSPEPPLKVEALVAHICAEGLELAGVSVSAPPTQREQVGAWNLEARLSHLSSCETWRVGRRLGSLYKEGALQWRLISAALSEGLPTTRPAPGVRLPLPQPLEDQIKRYQALNSPRLARLLDAGWDPLRQRAYVVEERLAGPSLLEAHSLRPLSPSQQLSVAREVMEALAVLHEANLTHGNLKLESVVWRGGGWALTTPSSLTSRLPGGSSPSARARGASLSAPERRQRWREALEIEMSQGDESSLPEPTPAHDLFSLGRLLQELLGEAGLSQLTREARDSAEELLWALTHHEPSMRGSARAWCMRWGQVSEQWMIEGEVERYSVPQLIAHLERDPQEAWSLKVRSPELPLTQDTPSTHSEEAAWASWWSRPSLAKAISASLSAHPLPSEALSAPQDAHLPLSEVHLSLTRPPLKNGSPARELSMSFKLAPPGLSRLNASYESERALWVSVTPVTRGQWMALMGVHEGMATRDEQPVESVRWLDAVQFCNALSDHLGQAHAYELTLPSQLTEDTQQASLIKLLSLDQGVRLPTPSEWAYLSLASQRGPYAGEPTPHEGVQGLGRTGAQLVEVATGSSNAWGLYDTCGLVWEWAQPTSPYSTQDKSQEGLIPLSAPICGGGWLDDDELCRATQLRERDPWERSVEQGFRVVIPVKAHP
jgi:serine/threonine protein kinase